MSLTICEIFLEAPAPHPKGCPENPTTIGQYIRQYRMINGYTIFELAMELEVYDSTIHKWEMEYSSPSKNNLQKIINFMGYDPRIHNPLNIRNYELIKK